MGIQGFPTLKTVRPGLKTGKPTIEDYQGPRNAKSIVDAVVDKIPNHVKRLQAKDLDGWLANGNDSIKAILFSEKGTTSALLRALAIDFLGVISVAQIRNKETSATEMFGISTFPKLVLLPGGTQDPLVYAGEMKKDHMLKFMSQFAPPNPDPAPKSAKVPSSKKSKVTTSSDSHQPAPSETSASPKSADAFDAAASGSTVVIDDFGASESPAPFVQPGETPVAVPGPAPPIATLASSAELRSTCLGPKTGTCLLILLPSHPTTDAALTEPAGQALTTFAMLANKHARAKAKMFPFYAVPAENEAAPILRTELASNHQRISKLSY